jgi:hypothetical protein
MLLKLSFTLFYLMFFRCVVLNSLVKLNQREVFLRICYNIVIFLTKAVNHNIMT